MEIENPGLLPFGVTINDIIDGISKIRNKVIVRVLHELGYIEKWGIGVASMMKSCEEAGLPPPEFKEISTRFRVTIHTKVIARPKIDTIDQKIIDVINEFGGLSTSQIASNVGLSSRTIRERLKHLLDLNYIYEIGTGPYDPNKKYKIVK